MAAGIFDPKKRRARLDDCEVEWWTPSWIWEAAAEVMGGIDLDPCSNSNKKPNVPARTVYSWMDDGLSRDWSGRVFLNPPYGREIKHWIEKAVTEYESGNVDQCVLVVPASVGTKWFAPLFRYSVCFYRGRVRFINGKTGVVDEIGMPTPLAFVYLGHRVKTFFDLFSTFGPIVTDQRDP